MDKSTSCGNHTQITHVLFCMLQSKFVKIKVFWLGIVCLDKPGPTCSRCWEIPSHCGLRTQGLSYLCAEQLFLYFTQRFRYWNPEWRAKVKAVRRNQISVFCMLAWGEELLGAQRPHSPEGHHWCCWNCVNIFLTSWDPRTKADSARESRIQFHHPLSCLANKVNIFRVSFNIIWTWTSRKSNLHPFDSIPWCSCHFFLAHVFHCIEPCL